MSVPDPASLGDWRTETAPSADGAWATASRVEDTERWAIIPPGTTVFIADDSHTSPWRAARWHADSDADLRGEPPAALTCLELQEVLTILPRGLRRWAKAEHHQAMRQSRAAAGRARATGKERVARRAQQQANELERQDVEARLHASAVTD